MDRELSLVEYHLHSAPCWWPLCSAQTGRWRAQCREVIRADTGGCRKHVLTFILLYQCLIEMIKMSSQDRLLGVECLRMRWKAKESFLNINECLLVPRHSETAVGLLFPPLGEGGHSK